MMNVWGEYQMLMKTYNTLESKDKDETFERIQKLQILFHIINNNPGLYYDDFYKIYKEKIKNDYKKIIRKEKLKKIIEKYE